MTVKVNSENMTKNVLSKDRIGAWTGEEEAWEIGTDNENLAWVNFTVSVSNEEVNKRVCKGNVEKM